MQGKEGGWEVEEASHAVKCWLNVTCNVLIRNLTDCKYYKGRYFIIYYELGVFHVHKPGFLMPGNP